MKEFLKENAWWVIILLCIAIVVAGLGIWTYTDHKKHTEWYNSLTPAEQQAYELQKQQEYESRIQRYEVTSVYMYDKPITNNFGGVVRVELCYAFTYVSGTTLYSIDDFQHREYGLTKVTVGDRDLYIVNNNGEQTRTLQLTKETLKSLTGGQ